MPELFKNLYNTSFYQQFTTTVQKVVPDFNSSKFINDIFNAEWETKELKQRMRHTTSVLGSHLSGNFTNDAKTLVAIIQQLKKDGITEHSIEYMFFPDYIEYFGINDYKTSVWAMEEITQFTSCEFAVRSFIIKYPKQMIAQMNVWASHSNQWVRRLATEGCRPRLPWAMALPELKKDPSAILPILEKLKDDSSETVRRSVANNLNDIAKDNPKIIIALAKQWLGKTKELDWVIKHGCRTLLKQGNIEVMQLFGFGNIGNIKVSNFTITTPKVAIGDALEFSFSLENLAATNTKIRLEYGLYYLKANGSLARKVFKISEKEYQAKSTTTIQRKQSFKVITTRKFYIGTHKLSLIINGIELDKQLAFELF